MKGLQLLFPGELLPGSGLHYLKMMKLSPSDSNQVTRLVGFMEYGNALANLDKLLKLSNEDEIKVYDEIVKERDEFAVYTNLARRLEPTGGTSIYEPPQGDEDDFQRRGLPWMTALARVELGAMLAAFTEVKNPFMSTLPNELDAEPFREILFDGARVH